MCYNDPSEKSRMQPGGGNKIHGSFYGLGDRFRVRYRAGNTAVFLGLRVCQLWCGGY